MPRDEHACDLDHIARQAAAVRAAGQALRVARLDLDRAISDALRHPNAPPVTRVAEYAGLSRESVYQALRRQQRRSQRRTRDSDPVHRFPS